MCKTIYKGAKAEAFLSLFENDKTLQDIARYRYIDGLTIEQTAMIVGYSERQINRFCKKIKEITEQEPKGWQVAVMNTFLGREVQGE